MTFRWDASPLQRRALIGASLPLLVAAVWATPAAAGVVETPNACQFNFDDEYRTQGVEVAATAPAAATVGDRFTLSGERLEVKLRPDLASDAAQVDAIPSSPGGTTSTITTRTWFALRGTNTAEGTQVIGPLTVEATTTAYSDPAGGATTATPFAYTPPKLPDTTWTASGGDIAFSQGAAGAITGARGQLPVGAGGGAITVKGSAVVQASLPSGFSFFMDCQPGTTNVTRPQAGAGTTFNPLVAAPFGLVTVAGPPSNPGGAPPKQPGGPGGGPGGGGSAGAAPAGRIGILSSRLVSKGGKVRVRVSCARDGADCAGTAHLRTRGMVRVGRRSAKIVSLTRGLTYRVPKGTSRTLTLTVGLDGRVVLKRRATQRVRLTLKPVAGRATVRDLVLRRG